MAPPATTKKASLAASVDTSTRLRAALIQAHRDDWKTHTTLYPPDHIKANFEIGKSGKISAEMLALRQKAERCAWDGP